ncbi:hypothetical protein [Kibdelosporangium philippinense]|uniref:hypothetical protein n=1 Tax=Kibdelosporangium philippinense TaxID=211113 RepID=UPI0036235B81
MDTLLAVPIRLAALMIQLFVDAAPKCVVGDLDMGELLEHRGGAGRVLVEESLIDQAFLHYAGEQGGEAPRVRARLDLQVEVREIGGLGPHRSITTNDRAGSRSISLSTTRARGKPCDCHGFLPTKTETSACSKSGRGMSIVELSVHPELAGFLLCQSI